MLKKIIPILLIALSCSTTTFSQIQVGDTITSFPMISGAFGYHLPANHLKEKFGASSTIGGLLNFKTKSNFIIGLEYNYLFGETVKNDSLFRNITTSNGYLIDGNGAQADLRTYERGFYSGITLGKIIPIRNSNPNSGIFINIGTGLLQHQIHIENPDNVTPQVADEYTKGYDQLSNGLAIKEFIGYLHFGQKNPINFYAGFEFYQAWTQSRRDYDFNLMGKDENTYFDSLWGIKIGWIFPLTAAGSTNYEKEYFYQ